jgi:hypothetical protein
VQVEREALFTRADETPVTWLDRKRAIAHVPLSDAELRHTVYPRLDDLYRAVACRIESTTQSRAGSCATSAGRCSSIATRTSRRSRRAAS